MFDYTMEHICSYTATLESPPELIGLVPEGVRLNAYVTGGEVTGDRIRGKVRPVGADWLTLRSDGVCNLDVRATIETHDGGLIYLAYQGVGDLGEDGQKNFLEGKVPEKFFIRTAPRLSSAHPDYMWVNRCQFVGIGEGDFINSSVAYDLYALR